MGTRVVQLSTPITALTINTQDWPEVAGVKKFDDKYTSYVRVLRHKDGRSIVYGMHSIGGKDKGGAEYVDAGGDVASAIKRVAAHTGVAAEIGAQVAEKL